MKELSCGYVPVFKISDEWQYLMIQHHDGHWGFPKGHTEKNETENETALREVKEETALKISQTILGFKYKTHYKIQKEKKSIDKTVIYYLGIVENMKVIAQKEEIADFQWANFAEATKKLSFNSSIDLLVEANQALKKFDASL